MRRLALFLILALFIPNIALAMTWGGVENFDSYTAGANLDTLNGGSGWSAAWTLLQGAH